MTKKQLQQIQQIRLILQFSRDLLSNGEFIRNKKIADKISIKQAVIQGYDSCGLRARLAKKLLKEFLGLKVKLIKDKIKIFNKKKGTIGYMHHVWLRVENKEYDLTMKNFKVFKKDHLKKMLTKYQSDKYKVL